MTLKDLDLQITYSTPDDVYKEFFNNRGEGIADISFNVKDLASETDGLIGKGANVLVSTDDCSIFDTRKEGNTIIKLLQIWNI